MTRRERRTLLAAALLLALVCSALFARAVFAQRASDLSRAQARAALLPERTWPSSDAVTRTMLDWSGGSEQGRYWQALQRFRVVTAEAQRATQYTLSPSLPLVFKLEQTVIYLRGAAANGGSRAHRSLLEDMLGLAYYADAELHRGQDPIEPELDRKAVAAFRRAVLLDPSNEAAKTNLEVLLRKVHRSRPATAPQANPLPDQARADRLVESANGLPSMNGAVGRRIHGGY